MEEKHTEPDAQVNELEPACVQLQKEALAMDFWSPHRWISARGRILNMAGKSLRQFKCRHCRRDFVEEIGTGARYAVHVSIFDFYRLADSVTDRWLKQPCPRTALRSDDDDRRTRRTVSLEPAVERVYTTAPVDC